MEKPDPYGEWVLHQNSEAKRQYRSGRSMKYCWPLLAQRGLAS